MCLMPIIINHIKKFSAKILKFAHLSVKGRIKIKNSPRAHIWACVFAHNENPVIFSPNFRAIWHRGLKISRKQQKFPL